MSNASAVFDNEDELPDDYPIYGDYLYVVDGKLYRSDWHGITARELRIRLKASSVCRCNLYARKADLEARRAALSKAEGHIGQELAPDPERRVNGNGGER